MSDFSDVLEAVFRDVVPILGEMGVQVVSAEPGSAHLRLPYRPEIGNHIGTVYAGVLFSFLETAGGALVLTSLDVSRWVPVIVEATIRYLRPVTGTIDVSLEMDAQAREALAKMLEENPKAKWNLTVKATDEVGGTVCDADLVYRFRSVG